MNPHYNGSVGKRPFTTGEAQNFQHGLSVIVGLDSLCIRTSRELAIGHGTQNPCKHSRSGPTNVDLRDCTARLYSVDNDRDENT